MNAAKSLLGSTAKVYTVIAGLYLLLAYAVQLHNGILGDVWFEVAWGIAIGAVQTAGIKVVKDTLVELELIQGRVTPQHEIRILANRLFLFQIITVPLGLSVLVVLSYMKLDAHVVRTNPWLLPAFLWACTPLCMWAVMVWNRPGPWSLKILTSLLVTAFLLGHRAFAFQWSAVLGDALAWALLLLGGAGLMGAGHFLREKTGWSTDQSETLASHVKWWFAQRVSSAQHVGALWALAYFLFSSLVFSEKSSLYEWVKVWNNPELAAANVFLPIRCFLFTALMLSSLCSERTHWRWQMLPGSGFRKHLGTEMFKTTGMFWLTIALAISILFVLMPRIWQPDALTSLLYAVHWRIWPFMIDGIFALGGAVWLRSVCWTSWVDIAAMFSMWLSLIFLYPRWALEDRSIEQDICMLCTAWLMVLRADKNFETSNWSWLKNGHRMGWMSKVKGG